MYILGGYVHLQTKIILSDYRDALKAGCAAVHQMSHVSHKDGMIHLYSGSNFGPSVPECHEESKFPAEVHGVQ